MARWRQRPVEISASESASKIRRRLSGHRARSPLDGFGPVTEPDQLGSALDKAVEIVENGSPAVVDAIAQPR
jgi:hypothetical protein